MGTQIIKKAANPGKNAEEEEEVKLICTSPPIDKVDESLNALKQCKRLSLSTNCLERMPALTLSIAHQQKILKDFPYPVIISEKLQALMKLANP